MYENMTFESIMKQALARVPDGVDKRQGSIIYDALAPACAELAQMYIALDYMLEITFAETAASGGHSVWLTQRCTEQGVHRYPASHAVRLGLFYTGSPPNRQPYDVPIGSLFAIETLHYTVTERITAGQYRVRCETPGIVGNQLYGRMIPVDTLSGLAYTELADVLIPGEEEETDEHLYTRYEEAVNEQPFGGNIEDYKRKIRAIEGVGDCKVYPVRRGGGTVDVVIIASDFTPPSETLVKDVQEALDPEPYHQQGRGLAPVGHWVEVAGVEAVPVNITTQLQLKAGMTVGQVADDIREALNNYFHELAVCWAKDEPAGGWTQEDGIIVRVSQIEARILNMQGIVDVTGTTINGTTANLMLGADAIPVFGGVTFL